MKCYKCGCMPVESGKAFYPIDSKGTHGRSWACESCMTGEQSLKIPQDVKEMIDMIQQNDEIGGEDDAG